MSPGVHGTVLWVLREYPYTRTSGQAAWLSSLLASAAAEGDRNVVLIPSGTNLPPWIRERRDGIEVLSPALRRVGDGLQVSSPRRVVSHFLFGGYKALPHRAQVSIAAWRRRLRRRGPTDHVLGREWSLTERAWITSTISAFHPRAVLFESAFSLTEVPPGVTRIVVLPDLVHRRAESLAQVGFRTSPAWVTREWEAERIQSADGVAAIQWDEAKAVRELVPDARVVVAPPAFHLSQDVVVAANPRLQTQPTCLFVGSGSLHNVDGIGWAIQNVWPGVVSQVPGARLRVVGTVATQIAPADRVDLLGEVSDLPAEYSRAAVVLVPLRAGSGLKVKLAEALWYGKAVVTTAVGAQGMTSFAPRPFALADEPSEFAAWIVTLLTDRVERSELEALARDAAHAFEPQEAHKAFIDMIRGNGDD